MYNLYIKENTNSEELLDLALKKHQIENYEIVYNENGKPYLKDKRLYFNMSNSKEVTVCVVSSKEVGIDIEHITYRQNVIDKICTDKEKGIIKTPDDFTRIWVMKESYVKWLGLGISYGLKNVDTTKIKNFKIRKYKDYYISVYLEE